MKKGKFETINQQGWESEIGFLQRQKSYLIKQRDELKVKLAIRDKALELACDRLNLIDEGGECLTCEYAGTKECNVGGRCAKTKPAHFLIQEGGE